MIKINLINLYWVGLKYPPETEEKEEGESEEEEEEEETEDEESEDEEMLNRLRFRRKERGKFNRIYFKLNIDKC